MYKNHHISGYYLDAIRFMDSAPKATPYFLISEGIRLLKNEGIKHLSLGPYIPRKFETSSFYSLLSYFAGFIYSFRGIERFKKHFTATQSPLYISYCTVFLLPYIWQGIHLTLQPTLAKSVLLKYKSIFS